MTILKAWAEIVVGDILIISDLEPIPADMVVLHTKQENGMCFISTSSLDGEKALKPKNCIPEVYSLFHNIKEAENIQTLD